MAITIVQSAKASGTSIAGTQSQTVPFGASPANGNLLIGMGSSRNGSFFEANNGALIQLDNNVGGGAALQSYYQVASSSPSSWIAVYTNSAGDYSIVGVELSGQHATLYLNGHSVQHDAAATTMATPSITPTVDNCLIVAYWSLADLTATPTATYNNGFTQLQLAFVTNLGYCAVATLQQGTAAAVSCTLTHTDAGGTIAGGAGIIAIAPAIIPFAYISYNPWSQRGPILAQ